MGDTYTEAYNNWDAAALPTDSMLRGELRVMDPPLIDTDDEEFIIANLYDVDDEEDILKKIEE